MSTASLFNNDASLTYLGLPLDYVPSPKTNPIPFLIKHLAQLPPHILLHFSFITTPKERTAIPEIRNRRLRYTQGKPKELEFEYAWRYWPSLWEGREQRRGTEARDEEKAWADRDFLDGSRKHIGNLGNLLGDYEEEREAEQARMQRRERAAPSFIPEEESSSDEDEAEAEERRSFEEDETDEEQRSRFERLIRERFIYGLLDKFDYDIVDWDETLDVIGEREAEDRWFDEEDED